MVLYHLTRSLNLGIDVDISSFARQLVISRVKASMFRLRKFRNVTVSLCCDGLKAREVNDNVL